MTYLILGLFTFPIMYLFDYLQYRNHPLKKVVGVLGFGGLFVILSLMTFFHEKQFIFSSLSTIGWLITIPFLFLLLWSLVIEIPFQATYVNKTKNQSLVNTGTYALTRHPGVLWLFMSILGLSFITNSKHLFYAALIYTLANIVYVYQQEKLFMKMLPGYKKYQKEVPMLIPTINSIKNCVTTVKGGQK